MKKTILLLGLLSCDFVMGQMPHETLRLRGFQIDAATNVPQYSELADYNPSRQGFAGRIPVHPKTLQHSSMGWEKAVCLTYPRAARG